MERHISKNYTLIILLSVFILSGCNRSSRTDIPGRDRLFNAEWKFIRDSLPAGQAGLPAAEESDFDDSGWLTVDLPHDWSIQALPGNSPDQIGPFSRKSPGKTSTGQVMGGTGWYRKHFTVDKSDKGKIVVLRFDGVYMEAEVWVNGSKAGEHTYGYTPFWFDITSFLHEAGKDNVIAVKVNNTGRNTRWYSGSGIYRNVHLIVTDPVHIGVWGVQVTTPVVTETSATVQLNVTALNEGLGSESIELKTKIYDPSGKLASTAETSQIINQKEKTVFRQPVEVKDPILWSVGEPSMYTAEMQLIVKGKVTDTWSQPFGIRTIQVSPEKGLLLNGVPLELKGGCMHHDNGLLGSAAFIRAEERRVEIMKANGFNAIRTSHNPPSEAFLNACDRLGMLVIDETFDIWEQPKNPQDYHRFFRNWWKKDVEAMILRDRNHPSVIFWSIGNEISERGDTSGIRIAKNQIAFIQQLDTTRFFTNAICEFWDHPGMQWEATEPAFELLTVGGYNYQWQKYEPDHRKFPNRIMMGTESVPMDAFENWQLVMKAPYVIGDFVWTGMDYLGEAGIGHTRYLSGDQQDTFAIAWPWFNAWCGDIDLIGGKKPQMYYRDVIWGNSPLELNVHASVPDGKTERISYWGWPDEFPTWNWKGNEDKPLQVSVYSTGSSVRLELNGRVIGEKEISVATRLKATFEVPYEPGELKAVALENGKEIAVKVLKTTGEPAAIRLTADRNTLGADRNDLSFVTIEIIDEFGQVVTDAMEPVNLTLTGNGELAGTGNACPWDMESIGSTIIRPFRGKAMAIVRPFAKAGEIILKVEGKALTEARVEIIVK